MPEAEIINRGRGPEIAGTRITVYTIFEYVKERWRSEDIAFWLSLRKDQVDVAIRYIEEHKEEVMAQYEKIMERINRGNPPELQAKIDASHGRRGPSSENFADCGKRSPPMRGILADNDVTGLLRSNSLTT